jgi:hypothetical protein
VRVFVQAIRDLAATDKALREQELGNSGSTELLSELLVCVLCVCVRMVVC